MLSQKESIYPIVFGFSLSVIGLMAMLLFASFSSLTCTRQESGMVDCVQQSKLFGLLPISLKKSIHDVSLAKVETNCFTRSDTLAYECVDNSLVIQGMDGYLRISPHFLNAKTAAETRSRINMFIRSPSEETLFIRSQNWANVILGLLFVTVPFSSLGALLLKGKIAG